MSEVEAAVMAAPGVGMEGAQPLTKKRRASENGIAVAEMKNGTDEKARVLDESYFASYSDIELHRTMIEDSVRTNAYQQAIFQNMEEDVRGKVVADVGCGTGILSMFCAQAGAKKVYAIDASKIAVHAKQLIEANGFEDVITVLQGKAEEVVLPEKVDIVVSEWMGYMLLYETMLPSVLYVRDKWLKPGGKMYPERAALYMALGEAQWITKYEEGTYDFWVSLNHVYNIDMSLLADHAVARYKDVVHVHMVAQEDVLSLPTQLCDLNLMTISADDLRSISRTFTLSSMGSRRLNSMVLWFDVWFPGGLKLSTSPDHEDTHWQNTVLPLATAPLEQDTQVKGELNITQDLTNHRFLNVDLKYSVDKGEEITRSFKMDDNCNDNDF
ncbi:protein arginine N-methyltransferase 6 [Procambarus clarkii]|uniref:protein arginine N-methyltransferase 6 n=1 Tax=Procambarus clarkii TaxID=6728 RepID=UPI001E670AC9|nr:protein arginine N-methyltransferase 6-like [Procambarus clarkii]XP_045618912.1 protein arginine N-methyltransferase 6-like [Procambarus clarkii]XP_045618920.1 protein arginine N-methyltransferase 6-like [Procambarus clarkii]